MQDILDNAREKAETIHNQVLTKWTIDGHSMDYWEDTLNVDLPMDLDASSCASHIVLVNKALNITYNHLARAESDENAAKLLYRRKYNDAIDQITQQYISQNKKAPAATTLASLAENQLVTDYGSISYLEFRTNFWKRLVEKLSKTQKQLETITWDISIDAKVSSGQM